MVIESKDKVRFHWWGDNILLINNMEEYCVLNEIESYFVEFLGKETEYNVVIGKIAKELETEDKVIRRFVNRFIVNYRKFVRLKENHESKSFIITGEKGKYYPVEIHVSLTNDCVQHCLHCYKSAGERHEYINTNDLMGFLDEMKEKVPLLTLSGGEPTLHPAFDDIINRYYQDYSICVLTSGYNITEEMMQVLIKAKRGIVLSVYSAFSDEHDYIAGRQGSYSEIMSTIKRAKNRKIPIGITTVLMGNNYESIASLVEYLKNSQIDNVTIGKLSIVGRAKENFDESYTDDKYNRQIKKLKKQYKDIIAMGETHQKGKNSILSPFHRNAGTLLWAVHENGEIHPCATCAAEKFKMGNIENFDKTILCDRTSYNEKIKKYVKKRRVFNKEQCPLLDEMS